MRFRTAVLLSGLCGASPAFAATFCVSTADELTAALASASADAAAANATSAEVRIRAGQYNAPAGGFHVDIKRRGIVIAGGYMDGGCQTRSLDASLTVLDGQHAVRPLTIDTGFLDEQLS